MITPPRKGAMRIADISPEVLKRIESGAEQALTLAEELAVNHTNLLRHCFPATSNATITAFKGIEDLPIVKRMFVAGDILLQEFGEKGIQQIAAHPSNLVRGWACFMVAAIPACNPQTSTASSITHALSSIEPLADDEHYGVREWAWLAIRPLLSKHLHESINQLTSWVHSPRANIRRFACESLRPRGVWCAHINTLKNEPALAIHLLTPLQQDPSKYVQDSVANWLNDASKTQPEWVQNICAEWQNQHPNNAATQYICKRALRSIKKAKK